MKKHTLVLLALFTFFLTACEDIENIFVDDPDPLITEADAQAQNYNLRTPKYNVQVAIDGDVDTNPADVLADIDNAATDFFNCQFAEGEDLGFSDFELPGGEVVPPMSELMVYVVPFTFECTAVDTDTCAGIHFGSSGIIVIAEESIGTCSDFALMEHEIAHRYGLEADHDNLEQFEACTSPPQCDFFDFVDIGVGG